MIWLSGMTDKDIPAGLSLCRAHGWNQVDRDWEIFLRLSPAGCRVARLREQIVGTVATLRYQDRFSWVGMVLVDPGHQRQGIGMRLLEEALAVLGNEATVKLDATPAGRKVYVKMGFKDEYPLSRMELAKASGKWESRNNAGLTPLSKTELAAVAVYDRALFGAGREELLEWLWEDAPQCAFIVKQGGRILGYCLGRRGYKYLQVGPVIAEDVFTAQDLVSAAVNNCAGQPVILDIPHHDSRWSAWLSENGCTLQRPFIRMFRGPNLFPGIPEKQFAITGPEFG